MKGGRGEGFGNYCEEDGDDSISHILQIQQMLLMHRDLRMEHGEMWQACFMAGCRGDRGPK
ncbi:hypothetical protein B0T18DRAFT_404456 [Schizothecium vesticola]|uniref:Uncharacterized protein n=1 Tax=Schizothecium vesticola TaxID=314040 RepID=A0AA40KAP7_9PEZI|nr:hypothetical protein B0T18DRAFT_404456 [Schizothecium vesticola]